MISSSPKELLAEGTDWRFLDELKRELKACLLLATLRLWLAATAYGFSGGTGYGKEAGKGLPDWTD